MALNIVAKEILLQKLSVEQATGRKKLQELFSANLRRIRIP
jgi:hypothetical protein